MEKFHTSWVSDNVLHLFCLKVDSSFLSCCLFSLENCFQNLLWDAFNLGFNIIITDFPPLSILELSKLRVTLRNMD